MGLIDNRYKNKHYRRDTGASVALKAAPNTRTYLFTHSAGRQRRLGVLAFAMLAVYCSGYRLKRKVA